MKGGFRQSEAGRQVNCGVILWVMSKTFRPWLIDQPQLLPASVEDFVPPDHLAHFVRDLVREQLDLSAIFASYVELRGYPPFDPRMMTALLLYGYSRGVYSSRRLARACEERVDFMAVTAMNRPDFRTISEFRRRHGAVLGQLFTQVLRLCQEAGLVELGHVALDGTKMKANASKHKAMSYGRMKKTEAELAAEVEGWLKAAEAADAEEDALHGSDRRGDERPDWMANKEKRLAKIREAKAALEAEAKAEAEEKAKQPKRYRGGRKPKREPGTPHQGSGDCCPRAERLRCRQRPIGADDRCRDREHWPEAGSDVGRQRLLLGGQPPGHGGSPDRGLHRHWSPEAWAGGCRWRRSQTQGTEGGADARALTPGRL